MIPNTTAGSVVHAMHLPTDRLVLCINRAPQPVFAIHGYNKIYEILPTKNSTTIRAKSCDIGTSSSALRPLFLWAAITAIYRS